MGVFKRPGSRYWQLRFYYNGKIRTKSAGTTNKRNAQKQLDVIHGDIAKGKFKLIIKSENISLYEYSVIFLD